MNLVVSFTLRKIPRCVCLRIDSSCNVEQLLYSISLILEGFFRQGVCGDHARIEFKGERLPKACLEAIEALWNRMDTYGLTGSAFPSGHRMTMLYPKTSPSCAMPD